MNQLYIILFSFFEIVSLIVIVRLWMRRRVKLVPRLFWSVVLLVPFFGLLIYSFLHSEPEVHPYESGWSGYSGGSDSGGNHEGHSGDGH